jgi:uridine phosphorylase
MSFPKFKNKHGSRSLLDPLKNLRHARKYEQYPRTKPAQGIILCYDKRLVDYIIRSHRARKIERYCGDLYLLKETKNRIGVACNFGIGAPAAAFVMEEFIAEGVKKFISIGEAGALQKNLKVGDFIVCTKAIRDEGTSHHYLKSSKYVCASKEITEKIEATMKKNGLKYVKGATWTIDAPFRETIDEVRKYQKEGVLTVEMEAAAVFAVAQYRKVKAGAIFTISDYLGELEWKPKYHLTEKHLEKLFQIAKDILLS